MLWLLKLWNCCNVYPAITNVAVIAKNAKIDAVAKIDVIAKIDAIAKIA